MDASDEIQYRKLPGSGFRRGAFFQVVRTRSLLAIGPDHLLLVDRMGFEESYKRFHFRNIQALTLTRTRRREAITVTLAVILLPVLAGVFANGGAAQVTFAIIAGVLFTWLLINHLLGPTCRCGIMTAAQTDELASLKRIPGAMRVFAEIQPLIAAAQETEKPEPDPEADGREMEGTDAAVGS